MTNRYHQGWCVHLHDSEYQSLCVLDKTASPHCPITCGLTRQPWLVNSRQEACQPCKSSWRVCRDTFTIAVTDLAHIHVEELKNLSLLLSVPLCMVKDPTCAQPMLGQVLLPSHGVGQLTVRDYTVMRVDRHIKCV